MEYKKNSIIVLGIITIFISLLFQKSAHLFISIMIYGIILFILGFYYYTNKYFFWATVISLMPWVSLIYFQFLKRLYYLVDYAGERSNGMGSPVLFLIGMLVELPFLIGITYTFYNIYKDISKYGLHKYKT